MAMRRIIISFCLTVSTAFSCAAAPAAYCAQQARDYANLVAPRTGAPTLRDANRMPPAQANAPRASALENPGYREMTQMAPNRDAYRAAFDRCMATR